jgi:hypothetical protein
VKIIKPTATLQNANSEESGSYHLSCTGIYDAWRIDGPKSGYRQSLWTGANPPPPNYEVFHIDSSIDTKGTLDAKMKLEERGDGELALRLVYRATPQNNWQELTQKIVGGMGFGDTVSDVSVEQPEDTAQPFWISFTYHRVDLPDWKNHRIVFLAPPIFIQELNEEQKLSKDPLPLGSPQEVTYESTVKFPKGLSPLLPQKVERKYDFAEFSATATFLVPRNICKRPGKLYKAQSSANISWKRTKSLARKKKLRPSATWPFLLICPEILLLMRSFRAR